MHEEYERPYYPYLRLRTMESPAQELDEAELEAAIAAVMCEELSQSTPSLQTVRSEFPVLASAEEISEQAEPQPTGLKATLRQKWAEFSGAA